VEVGVTLGTRLGGEHGFPVVRVPARTAVIRSRIPARIDRLLWSPFHIRMVMVLGVAGVLDGLETTVVGAVAGGRTVCPLGV